MNYQLNMVSEDTARHYLMLQMLLCGSENRSSLQERCRLLKHMILNLGSDDPADATSTPNINEQNQVMQLRRNYKEVVTTLDRKRRLEGGRAQPEEVVDPKDENLD